MPINNTIIQGFVREIVADFTRNKSQREISRLSQDEINLYVDEVNLIIENAANEAIASKMAESIVTIDESGEWW
jgi:hypothetical protein